MATGRHASQTPAARPVPVREFPQGRPQSTLLLPRIALGVVVLLSGGAALQRQHKQAARANLLKLTVKGRQEQLALKAKWKADELAQDKLRIAHTMRENERLEELEKQAAAQQAQARKDNQTAVKFQIRKKADTRAREKQSEYLQLRQMQHSEKQYMKRLADMKRF